MSESPVTPNDDRPLATGGVIDPADATWVGDDTPPLVIPAAIRTTRASAWFNQHSDPT